jgi:hypothetical protein
MRTAIGVYALNPAAFASLREYFDEFWTQALTAFKEKAEGPRGRRKR